MRGKVAGGVIIGVLLGITPAYAGKRVRDSFCKDIRWDHPRVCGEKLRWTVSPPTLKGSPPRMRGKVPLVCKRSTVAGITPAYAGKSQRSWCPAAQTRDHPRVCGEKPRVL